VPTHASNPIGLTADHDGDVVDTGAAKQKNLAFDERQTA
jgi:hypothetical protein